MQPAQEEVARVLDGIALHDPQVPVAANVTGSLVTTAAEAKDALIRQVTGAVRWVDCAKALVGAGATTFVEVGPGKVLTGLIKQIDSTQKALNVEDPATLEKALTELRG
jgi:[acyl-carrier-protein] S-malonyltransferase